LYQNFSNVAQRRFELGETNYLEKITAKSKQRQVNLNLVKAEEDVIIAYNLLMSIIQSEDRIEVTKIPLLKIALDIININESPEIAYYSNTISLLETKRHLEKQRLLPDISLEYFQGTNSGINTNLYGYQIGLKIPLLFTGKSSRIKASKIAETIQHQKALDYYEQEGTDLSNEILKTANSSFKNGEIDFYQYILSLENAYDIQLNHLESLNNYNQNIIAINYLTF
jgi:cobalt-zinc-cadmium resistance protein CzcA